MRTIVLGAGIVGVTTAYYLAKAGRDVTLIDRQPDVAKETSFANAGLVAPGHSYTWASPKAPGILLKSLFLEGQALRLRLNADPKMWIWGMQFLRNCTAERSRLNTSRKLRLCVYSQKKLQEITAQEQLNYDRIEGGLLYLYGDEASLSKGRNAMKILQDGGLKLESLSREEAILREPSLALAKRSLAGALFCPSDESGDAYEFTRNLAQRCRAMGVRFEFNRQIKGFNHSGDRVHGVITDKGVIEGDEFVLALGSYSPLVAKKLGYSLPVYPVKGYSVTLPITEKHQPPTLGGVDENNLVAWARFGNKLRFTATAEFAGYSTDFKPSDFDHMLKVAQELFPNGADYTKPSYWSCLRPMTPAGGPILGKSRHKNLYMNTGHGHMGWTMACGTSQILTDIMNHRSPDIDIEGFTLL